MNDNGNSRIIPKFIIGCVFFKKVRLFKSLMNKEIDLGTLDSKFVSNGFKTSLFNEIEVSRIEHHLEQKEFYYISLLRNGCCYGATVKFEVIGEYKNKSIEDLKNQKVKVIDIEY